MNTQDQIRELLTQERLEAEHQQKNVLIRATESIEAPIEPVVSEEARELLTQERLEAEHQQENVLMRAAESQH
ncbi:hypothetical protein V2H45_14485 [Tumidithrix elongata RA019]|uniref:Uncharacterized protein n=1 Tax=Tumidithrix elongata BACA0141 TaxID=2716417 RepID=A0AAW9Q266_9CYAN|nr:hypothetical protein [Tumidithrix elongata RA019]